MLKLTPQGQQTIDDIAQRHGVSTDAVMTVLRALINGNGRSAQFSHPELGGSGQWMQGGMTMVGDMFNHALKAKVDGLCSELSTLLSHRSPDMGSTGTQSQSQSRQDQQQSAHGNADNAVGRQDAGPDDHAAGRAGNLLVYATTADWWPSELGAPSSSGSQNGIRYAFFPRMRRLAIEVHGKTTVYDTADHQIGGVSQQQAAGASLTFTSQRGPVDIANLPIVSTDSVTEAEKKKTPESFRIDTPVSAELSTRSHEAPRAASETGDALAIIERLAELRQKGILTEEEFAAKKSELLGRL